MVRIAITGGIACGKSLVGAVAAAHGVEIIDADDIAHEMMQPGHRVFQEVVRQFGRGILDEAGCADRQALGKLVFANAAQRRELNAIVHPEVRKVWQEWLAQRPHGLAAAAVIIPLYYEVGEGPGWDVAVCVACTHATQMERLRQRGLSEDEAQKRIAAQMALGEKIERADYVIMNDGTKQMTEDQTVRVLGRILEN